MALAVISTPERTINGILSRSGFGNQVPFEFQRQDYVYDSVDIGNEIIFISASFGDVTFDFDIGDTIYVSKELNYYTVAAVTFDGTRTRVTTNENLTTSQGGYLLLDTSKRQNYRAAIEINISGSSLYDGQEFFYRPKTLGDLFVDLAGLLNAAFVALANSSIIYSISYREAYTGSTDTPTTTQQFQAIAGRRQILSLGGTNAWDFILKEESSPYDAGKFLTSFPRSVLSDGKAWKGWAKKVYYIRDLDLSSRVSNTTIRVVYVDQNKTSLGVFDNYIEPLTPSDINSREFLLAADLVNNDPTYLYVRITDDIVGGNPLLCNGIYYLLQEECRNPVMIEWLNPQGGFDNWLFTINQVFDNVADTGITFERTIETDYEVESGNKGRFTRRNVTSMLLSADDINQDELKALHSIKESGAVRVWLNKDGSKFVSVVVSSLFSTELNTDRASNTFNLQIEFPDNYYPEFEY